MKIHKLMLSALFCLVVCGLGCRKKAETNNPGNEFLTPAGSTLAPRESLETAPIGDDADLDGAQVVPTGPIIAGPAGTTGELENRARNETIETKTFRYQTTIEVQPPDAKVSVNGDGLPVSVDGKYSFESSTNQSEIAIHKPGWRTFRKTARHDRADLQMVIALSPDPQWWYEQARQQFERGELLAALSSLGIVDAIEPIEMSAQALKLQIFLRLERPQLAQSQLARIEQVSGSQGDFAKERINLELLFAKDSLNRNETPKALAHLTRAIDLGSEDAWAFQCRGLASLKVKDWETAVNDLRRAISIDGALRPGLQADLIGALFQRAKQLREQGDQAASLQDIESILSFSPDHGGALNLRAGAMNAVQKFDAALRDSGRVLELLPENLDARLESGFALAGKTQFADAMGEFGFVLDRKHDHAVALKSRGFCQLQVGNLKDAIDDLGRAILARPDDGEAHFLRGVALLKANQPAQALNDLRHSLEFSSEPDVDLHYYLAAALEQSGQFTEAIQQYDAALELDSNHFASRLNRCILLANQGQADLAFDDASVALSINPKHAIAVNSRGAANVLRGKLDDAQADFDLAIELAPDYAEAWFNRGLLQSRQQRYRGAIDDFSQAIKQDPDSIEFYLERAKAMLQVGEFANAKSDLNLILELDPKHGEATRLRAILPREE